MRWDDLFADMEAQLAAARYRDIELEAAELTRAETSEALLEDRFAAHIGHRVRAGLRGGLVLEGCIASAGTDWTVVEDAGSETLVPIHAIDWVEGLGLRRQSPEQRRRLGLPHAIRALAQARAGATVHLASGPAVLLEGTVDRAGRDHLDLALHPHDEFRRRRSVRSVRTVPYAAIACVVAQGQGAGS
ncbi:hypothetical protein FCK90_00730 [Kocuria coralli]|uniref:Fis family transcriptional regulator n=1 Tax=Kocuria coralli TaxID=1461025 RepID=A0A5J5L3C0_9MICC|nr:hypothetical protein [Kocuria coralli]KAA9395586.1 hypothetical protein FCK90_00730 [Kocuria coralli]